MSDKVFWTTINHPWIVICIFQCKDLNGKDSGRGWWACNLSPHSFLLVFFVCVCFSTMDVDDFVGIWKVKIQQECEVLVTSPLIVFWVHILYYHVFVLIEYCCFLFTICVQDRKLKLINIIRMVTFGGGNITRMFLSRGVWNDIEGRLSVPRRSRGTYNLPEISFQTPRYLEHSVKFPTTKSPSVILYGSPLPCPASA